MVHDFIINWKTVNNLWRVITCNHACWFFFVINTGYSCLGWCYTMVSKANRVASIVSRSIGSADSSHHPEVFKVGDKVTVKVIGSTGAPGLCTWNVVLHMAIAMDGYTVQWLSICPWQYNKKNINHKHLILCHLRGLEFWAWQFL